MYYPLPVKSGSLKAYLNFTLDQHETVNKNGSPMLLHGGLPFQFSLLLRATARRLRVLGRSRPFAPLGRFGHVKALLFCNISC